MRSCIVLGSGRSGTSMAAGLFHRTGYYMGNHLVPAGRANPLGFFEDFEVNAINEELIAGVTARRPRGPLKRLPAMRRRPNFGQRWLAEVPLDTVFRPSTAIGSRISQQVKHPPYCLKDPRFCYTLPAWRPYLNDPIYLCVFRHPSVTARSILREIAEAPYLRSISLTYEEVEHRWTLMYRHVLERHRSVGHWMFLHYDELADGTAVSRIEAAVGVPLDRGFPDSRLSRSTAPEASSSESLRVYTKMLALTKQ